MTDPATKAAEAMREAAAQNCFDAAACSEAVGLLDIANALKRRGQVIRNLPLPEPAPDPREVTIATLSAELEAAREALEPFAAYAEWIPHLGDGSHVLSMQRGRLDWMHVRAGDFRRARAVLAKLAKGE